MKLKNKILPILNIILPIIFSILILILDNSSEKVFYILFITGIVGWIFPLFTQFITGIVELRKVKLKTAIILNILSLSLNGFILYFIIRLMDKSLIIILTIYLITAIISIINIVYLKLLLKKDTKEINRKKENEIIKKIKKDNNGAIK